MGFLSALFGASKLNADTDQQHLARLLIDCAEQRSLEYQITNFLIQKAWSASETRNRIAHAVSITKISSVPATYARVKEIGMRLHNISRW